MDNDARVLVIVEPRAFQLTVVHSEAQRLDEMEVGGRIGGEPDHVAGIGRDFRMDENDGKHDSPGEHQAPGVERTTRRHGLG